MRARVRIPGPLVALQPQVQQGAEAGRLHRCTAVLYRCAASLLEGTGVLGCLGRRPCTLARLCALSDAMARRGGRQCRPHHHPWLQGERGRLPLSRLHVSLRMVSLRMRLQHVHILVLCPRLAWQGPMQPRRIDASDGRSDGRHGGCAIALLVVLLVNVHGGAMRMVAHEHTQRGQGRRPAMLCMFLPCCACASMRTAARPHADKISRARTRVGVEIQVIIVVLCVA